MANVVNYLKLLRIKDYIKNSFIIFPAFFASNLFSNNNVGILSIGILAFCALASGVYIFNDYHDIEFDRLHPQKKDRPLANGCIPIPYAVALGLGLLSTGLGLSTFLGIPMLCISTIYLVLNVSYTIKLKQVPILDVFVIAIGFVLRLYYGAYLVTVSLSQWIIIVTFLLALFLGFSKRYHDVLIYKNYSLKCRKVVDGYTLELLQLCMGISGALVMVSYIFYTLAETQNAHIITVLSNLCVVFGLFYYLKITIVDQNSQNPTTLVYRNKPLQATIALWLVGFVYYLYFL